MKIEDKKNLLVINKIDAAERQLVEAIKMFFERKDPICIHTLTGAALGILESLAQVKHIENPIGKNSCIIKDSEKKVWRNALAKHRNFFKHADSDPDNSIEFDSRLNELNLISAIVYHNALTSYYLVELLIFQEWFLLKYPKYSINREEQEKLSLSMSKSGEDLDDFDSFRKILDIIDPSIFKFQRPVKRLTL